jgi:hypothetical protein
VSIDFLTPSGVQHRGQWFVAVMFLLNNFETSGINTEITVERIKHSHDHRHGMVLPGTGPWRARSACRRVAGKLPGLLGVCSGGRRDDAIDQQGLTFPKREISNANNVFSSVASSVK